MHRYITTTLPYVNADPHIGFAVEILQADVLARTWRERGDEVFFTTGTDEHGQKILQKAQEGRESVQDYVDRYAASFRALIELLGISSDAFVRTTDPAHVAAAQELWRRCAAAGDIYKKTYEGLYCVGDEAFVKEGDLVDGKCPNHPTMDPIAVSEENYFFRLSAYQDRLHRYLAEEGSVYPEWRRQEALAFVEAGLEDFSISREAARMPWGIPVLGDDTQVMYVWFDALTNYLSTLGWPDDDGGRYRAFWEKGVTLQMAGKDQVRFQSIMWQAMLISAGLPTTDTVFYHGFITSAGQKMSKSLGNVIEPQQVVNRYGVEAARYLLLRHVHPTDDTDITFERLDEWYTAHLVNGVGNLTARIMTLAEKHLAQSVVLETGDTELEHAVLARIDSFSFNEALDLIFAMVGECDGLMTERAPFSAIKSDDEQVQAAARADMVLLVRHLGTIAAHLRPFMPHTAESIQTAIVQNKKPENLFPRLA
jgi:methionyl-tRNA synthetase